MARSTKQEALATRNRLLDAAEVLFQAQGVSQTSLQQIAQQAGATRGAIYWHFKDKADLFNAMMERVTLPLEAAGQAAGAAQGDPIGEIVHRGGRCRHDGDPSTRAERAAAAAARGLRFRM